MTTITPLDFGSWPNTASWDTVYEGWQKINTNLDNLNNDKMEQSTYDPSSKEVDVYNMDNMDDGTTYVKTTNDYTTSDKNAIASISDKMDKSVYDPTSKNVSAFDMDNMTNWSTYVKTENNYTDSEKSSVATISWKMTKTTYDTANKQVDVYDMDNMENWSTYVKTTNDYTTSDKNLVATIGGKMDKSVYDPTSKNVSAFDMDNMDDGTTYVKTTNDYTTSDKNLVATIADKANIITWWTNWNFVTRDAWWDIQDSWIALNDSGTWTTDLLSADEIDDRISAWGGSWEVNTASNVWTWDWEVFKQKTWIDLELKTIKAWTNITVTNNASDIEISAASSVWEANTGSNVGTGDWEVFKQKAWIDFEYKTIKAWSNITVTNNASDIEIATTWLTSWEVNTASNVWTWDWDVFKQKTWTDLELKTIKAWSNITVTNNASDIEIDYSWVNMWTNSGSIAATYGTDYVSSAIPIGYAEHSRTRVRLYGSIYWTRSVTLSISSDWTDWTIHERHRDKANDCTATSTVSSATNTQLVKVNWLNGNLYNFYLDFDVIRTYNTDLLISRVYATPNLDRTIDLEIIKYGFISIGGQTNFYIKWENTGYHKLERYQS